MRPLPSMRTSLRIPLLQILDAGKVKCEGAVEHQGSDRRWWQLLYLPGQAAAASTRCLQSWDRSTTYKLLLGLFYSKRPCYFLELEFLCKNNKTQLLPQAPGKITEPQYSMQQLPCPA